ncbi:hypothetical protein PRN20_15710 [Devosia sp. ZB163]|uniref:hypothetical protein n=1 Tax=Devosia sp. ZB163 TaxID=3025938 RepID=UPI002360B1E2|nr:hypothetical protein [Devosia sp. ZB163]MDC9825175.1 hypothetical protein [Devosia sp. ZB163]
MAAPLVVYIPPKKLSTGFSGLDGSGALGSVATGLSWQSPGALSLDGGLLFNIDGSGETFVGARVGSSTRF